MTNLTREQVLQIIEAARVKGEMPELSGANLPETELLRAELGGTKLSEAEILRAKLSGVELLQVDLGGVDLHGADLIGVNLSQADLSMADLSGANLFMANLSEANLSGANVSGAKLFKTNLTQAKLKQANLSGANLSSADCSRADLSSVDLREANLKRTNLKQANLSGANLSAAKYDQATAWPANFDPTQTGAIRDEMITGSDLRRLIELAFDYVLAETAPQAAQARYQAAMLATEATTFNMWLDLIDYMKEWNHSNEHKEPMSRASALQFISTRQAELNPARTGNP